MKIAFVCIGNTCRSQMAEGLCHLLGVEGIDYYSFGIRPTKGIEENTILVLKEEKIDISHWSTKGINHVPEDIDLYVVLDNGIDRRRFKGQVLTVHVDDPYGKNLDHYRIARDEIKEILKNLRKCTKIVDNEK